MQATPSSFLTSLLAVVLGTTFLVMSLAFVSIPLALGAHPGEGPATASRPAFHPT